MINISINLGPGAIWLAMVFVVCGVAWAAFLAGGIAYQMRSARDIQHRQQQMLIAPWQAPGPPLLPKRVDPGLALLSRYTPIEEEEAA